MPKYDGVWYPDIDFVDEGIPRLIRVLFPFYEDGGELDFQYLGDEQGRGALRSSLDQPRQGFGEEVFYPSIANKAAVLLRLIIKNHPFIDGNKRVGFTVTCTFLVFNKYILLAGHTEAINICKDIASSKPYINQNYVSDWIDKRIISFDDISSGHGSERISQYISNSIDFDIPALDIYYLLKGMLANAKKKV